MSFPLILQVQRLGKSGRMNSAGISVVIVIWWILLTHTNEISQSQLQTKKKKTKQIEIPFLKIYKDTVDPSIKPNEPMQISVIKSDYHKSAAIN